MTDVEHAAPRWVPLGGLTAIEASAGTGKTFTIEELYVRLLVEHDLDVASILVVTYTKAATAELRRRLRERLEAVADGLGRRREADPFVTALAERIPDRAAAETVLRRAVQAFDEAAVFTIHGFCQRVLADYAFESGVVFDAELLPDQEALLLEVVDDFWRTTLQDAPAGLVAYLLKRGWNPEALRDHLRETLAGHHARVLAPPVPMDLADREWTLATAAARVRVLWHVDRAVVSDLLASPALKGPSYGPDKVRDAIAHMETWAGKAAVGLQDAGEVVERWSADRLRKATRKGAVTPAHPFFDACAELMAASAAVADGYACAEQALRAALLARAARDLAARKRERGVQYYDDLLTGLARALDDPVRGRSLAEVIRRRYRAALVDEFQDTDPVQYGILRRIYHGTELPVVVVGDPKQAIYAFRGADVFSYLRARDEARHRAQLTVNRRADASLVHAVNALFGMRRDAFVLGGIPFTAAVPADDLADERLRVGDDEPGALRLWWFDRDGKPEKKDTARARVADATAGEIARLLALGNRGEARCKGRALAGGDIAVLVRTNGEGRRVREALLAWGIPCVQQAVDSVFAAREAEELERVLLAVADPGRNVRVRAALTTELLGVTAEALDRLDEAGAVWEAWVEAFHGYHHRWRSGGLSRMLRELLVREGVIARLLAFADGERRVTNLLHLAELLQAEAGRLRSGMDAVVEWLADERGAAGRGATSEETALVRLESDASLVKIVTIHKAKGLQYPIVFCPFLWDGYSFAARSPALVYHEEGADGPTLDYRPQRRDEDVARARAEELAERVRLLYVAVTRAEHRCYLAAGRVNGGGGSCLAWLLHARDDAPTPDAIDERYKASTAAGLRADVERFAAAAGTAVCLDALPHHEKPLRTPRVADQTAALVARRVVRAPGAGWSIGSFTSLVEDGGDAERPDYDQRDRGQVGAAIRDRFGFPRGAAAGRCLHDLLEALDFVAPDARVVPRILRAHGLAVDWAPVVEAWMGEVLATPLDDTGGLCLGRIARRARHDELEFHYPARRVDVAHLVARLREAGFAGGGFGPATARPAARLDGFLKGYVDAVIEHEGRYFVVDYKSNRLGDGFDAHAAPALVAAMARGTYWLQYLVYTLAVHRLLERRVAGYEYERHFGGVYYLFLRGMTPARGNACGVYRDRPSRAVVAVLDDVMRGVGG